MMRRAVLRLQTSEAERIGVDQVAKILPTGAASGANQRKWLNPLPHLLTHMCMHATQPHTLRSQWRGLLPALQQLLHACQNTLQSEDEVCAALRCRRPCCRSHGAPDQHAQRDQDAGQPDIHPARGAAQNAVG